MLRKLKDAVVTGVFLTVAAQPAPITAFHLESSPASWVGQGETFLLQQPDLVYIHVAVAFDNSVGFSITHFPDKSDLTIDRFWSIQFAAPRLERIHAGSYSDATRYPFQDRQSSGLSFSGEGRGNNRLQGSFAVLEAEYNADGSLRAFAADFTQYDERLLEWWNEGRIRYNSSVPLFTPEPASAVLAGASLLAFIAIRRLW